MQVHVSNLNGLSEELQVDICDPNNSTFSTLEVKLENNSITVTSGSSVTLPTANINEVISVSIGNAPGRPVDGHSAILYYVVTIVIIADNFAEDQLLFLLSEGVNQAGFLPGFIGCVLEVNINGVIFSDLSDLSFDEAQDIMVGICPL